MVAVNVLVLVVLLRRGRKPKLPMVGATTTVIDLTGKVRR